jgi:heme exporter protein D
MGQFVSFTDFLQMGKHGLYVWLSYGLFLTIIIYNSVVVIIQQHLFFKQAKRQLRRQQKL